MSAGSLEARIHVVTLGVIKSRQMCQAIVSSQEDIPMIRSFFAKEDGQGLVEYALILVLIAIVVIGILSVLGTKVSTVFSSINSGLK
jgi:pilus assembly protein Flp/PilA